MQSVAELLNSMRVNVNVICSGAMRSPSVEDTICGGQLIHLLAREKDFILNDGAVIAESFYLQNKKDICEIIKRSVHGRELIGLGHTDDLDLCIRQNISRIIPVYSKRKIQRGTEDIYRILKNEFELQSIPSQ